MIFYGVDQSRFFYNRNVMNDFSLHTMFEPDTTAALLMIAFERNLASSVSTFEVNNQAMKSCLTNVFLVEGYLQGKYLAKKCFFIGFLIFSQVRVHSMSLKGSVCQISNRFVPFK